ncbi:NAD(P)-dependent oxidoreductase [Actinoplanes sp. NPDC089786]|uniref:NAD-dependent epimerase/dehydratase family protein n=1 Tax=Actinoplanes sp. NPDC089786 TaxID=3155185 RepID=UPI00342EC9D8
MDVFLTGGSGFAGAAIIRKLVADGHVVHGLARSSRAAEAVAAAGALLVRGDLEELVEHDEADSGVRRPSLGAGWVDVLGKVDAVVHAAALMAFWGPDELFIDRNLRPALALYRAAVAAKVKRFVLLSAASVSTGGNDASVVDEISDTGRPNIAYSRIKLRTEQEMLSQPHEDTALVILRPPFLWGRGMNLRGFIDTVEAGRFSWIDEGRHTIDFCHVENLAHAAALALTRGEHGLVCYVTDDSPRAVREFFTPLLATQGIDVSKAASYPRAIASPLATLMQTLARARRSATAPPLTQWIISFMGRDRAYDITRARTALGYTPAVTVDEGLRQMTETPTPGQ